ncbi:hypothetical protein [Helicobacter pylori]|uniref:hypothetical protein n=1 Tax=Helicobacter pylori TaxID=210 RepID=UPI000BEA06BD|nr:hypothetical protein [Helicobacter pylori]PDX35908.1 hypothetical protein BB460_01290 [Helicobacter pylori]
MKNIMRLVFVIDEVFQNLENFFNSFFADNPEAVLLKAVKERFGAVGGFVELKITTETSLTDMKGDDSPCGEFSGVKIEMKVETTDKTDKNVLMSGETAPC